MCGICGASGLSPDRLSALVETMLGKLHHRGPDDRGIAVFPAPKDRGVGLANARLAILDLSPKGHQPMSTPDGALTVAYNGEIYNFQEIRSALAALGHQFTTATDTEVILYAYRHWGVEMFGRFRGMFALALWDAAQGKLLLARDRVGIKPLYYWQQGGRLLFASEVRALLASDLIPRALSPRGLNGYLALGSVQDPDTLVDGVQALPAGHYAIWRGGSLRLTPYWQPHQCARPHRISSHDAVAQVRELLEESVRLHCIADVPIGVFLSGGLDSTALLALMVKRGYLPRTLSVTFPDSDLSEEAASRSVAAYYGVDHTEIALTGASMRETLPAALHAMDQPTVDGVNTFMVTQQAGIAGLKVAMSGLGSDELFGGYPSFSRYPRLRTAVGVCPPALQRALAPLAAALPVSGDAALRIRDLLVGAYGRDPFPALRTLFTPTDRRALSGAAATGLPAVRAIAAQAMGLHGAQRTSLWELSYYMKNMLLRDSDVMSMAHSVELRVPFVDHQLIEFVLGLPSRVVLPPGRRLLKPLLSEAVAGLVPDDIRRRRKMGFTFPFATWLRSDLRAEVEATLLHTPCPALDDALNPSAVAGIWRHFLAGRTSWHRPWTLYVLKRWADEYLAA